MFSKSDFQSWAKGNVVRFAAVMTKIEGRKDDSLLRTYGFRGFPSMALLDAEGEVITKKIAHDLFTISNTVAAAVLHQKIQKQIDAGEDYNKADWYMARLGMGELSFDDAKSEFATIKLSAEQKTKAEQQILVMEVSALQTSVRGREVPEGAREAAMTGVYQIFKSGRRLPETASQVGFFDSMLIDAAKKNNDAAAFKFSYARVHAASLARIESMQKTIPRIRLDIDKYKDDEKMLKRVERALERYKQFIERAKKDLVELEAQAEKFKSSSPR